MAIDILYIPTLSRSVLVAGNLDSFKIVPLAACHRLPAVMISSSTKTGKISQHTKYGYGSERLNRNVRLLFSSSEIRIFTCLKGVRPALAKCGSNLLIIIVTESGDLILYVCCNIHIEAWVLYSKKSEMKEVRNEKNSILIIWDERHTKRSPCQDRNHTRYTERCQWARWSRCSKCPDQ